MVYHFKAMIRLARFSVALCGALIIGFCVHSAVAQMGASDYQWPIPRFRSLSSIFADYRYFRFHSGIDIPTQGKTGYQVLACQSGYVYRVYASWKGYGKALYLKLDNGEFAVYGHLSGFSERIADLVAKKQLANQKYHLDWFPQENEFRVEKGEIIGYSGDTGWGGPHLHFELRDSENHPLNPLTSGLFVADGIPPVMQYMVLRPLNSTSRVDGSAEPEILSLSYDHGSNVYRPGLSPIVEGEVGLEISVYDKMDDSGFKFGILGLEMYLDGDLLFSSRYDRISFETTHQIELDRDFELRQTQGKSPYKLYVEPGNQLPLYRVANGQVAARSPGPESHTVTIKALDASGNVATAEFTLIFDRAPSILSCSTSTWAGRPEVNLVFEDPDDTVKQIILEKRGWEDTTWQEVKREAQSARQGEMVIALEDSLNEPTFLRVKLKDGFGAVSDAKYLLVKVDQLGDSIPPESLNWNPRYQFENNTFAFDIRFSQVSLHPPRLLLKSGGFDFEPLFLEQTDVKEYRVSFPFYLKEPKEMTLLAKAVTLNGDTVQLQQEFPVAIVTPSGGGRAVNSDGKARVEMEPHTVYDDINVSIEDIAGKPGGSRKAVSGVYSFRPSTVPLNGWAKVSIEYPSQGCDPSRLGLYELTGRDSWSFVGQDQDVPERAVAGRVRYLSTYALLEDTLAPTLERVSIRPGAKIKNRKPKITALVKDDLSGTGEDDDMEIRIDGQWLISEYDVDNRILSAHPMSALASGEHTLVIRAHDRVGNQAEITRQFMVIGNK
jgi:hypothetical protein